MRSARCRFSTIRLLDVGLEVFCCPLRLTIERVRMLILAAGPAVLCRRRAAGGGGRRLVRPSVARSPRAEGGQRACRREARVSRQITLAATEVVTIARNS